MLLGFLVFLFEFSIKKVGFAFSFNIVSILICIVFLIIYLYFCGMNVSGWIFVGWQIHIARVEIGCHIKLCG